MTSVLVTGAAGFLGRQAVAALARDGWHVVAFDVRTADAPPGVTAVRGDIREADLESLLRSHGIDTVIHLASIVTPGRGEHRAFAHAVEVDGTRRLIDACVAAGVRHLVVSSSGAAYGYHADNPVPLRETDALRGNEAFAYAWHKRLVEQLLAQARRAHPALRQTVLRIGTILGATVDNQITDLFDKRRLIGVRGTASPFVFVWDEDVVALLLAAVRSSRGGIYNVCGDGTLTLEDIGRRLGKPVLALPAGLLRAVLRVLRALRLTQYGPEQVGFLQYRPVLDNTALKRDFGFVPGKTTAQAFEHWRQARAAGQAARRRGAGAS